MSAAGFEPGAAEPGAATAGSPGTSATSSPPSEPYRKGSCLLLVDFKTSSRVKPNTRRRSRPGLARYLTSAAVNGLFLLSPSEAVDPALAAKATSVFGLFGSILASPRLTAREPMVRFMVWLNGLSRHASR